jgi:type II secretion system protein J
MRGFTLIEVLVALSMAAILAVSLSASLKIAFDAQASAQKAVEPSRTGELAMELIRSDLQNAMQPKTNSVMIGSFEGTNQTNGSAEADDLVFYTTSFAPEHTDANGEIKEVELTVEQQPNGELDLVRRVSANLTAEVQPAPDEEVICRNVTGFALQYFDGSNWNQTWDSTAEDNTIPAAVEATISFTRPGGAGQADQVLQFQRIFPLSCSTAAFDSNVNSGLSLQ